MIHTVFLALGSNLGDRLANLQAALTAMQSFVRVLERSPVYETPPWGYQDQPDFLNQVVKAETELSPSALLAFLKKLEAKLGRQKTIVNGPRIIDLDILFYDDLVQESPKLTIPHPRMPGRAFVLVPLADLAPNMLHPVFGITVLQMLADVDQKDIQPYTPGQTA